MFELRTKFGNLQILDAKVAKVILSESKKNKGQSFHFVNAFVLAEANKNKEYFEILANGKCFCDSRILEVYSRIARSPIQQLRGFDFLKYYLPISAMGSQLIIGGTQKSEDEILKLVSEYFGNQIDFSFHQPDFSSDISALHASSLIAIERNRPKTIWLGIGTPKQDYLASRLKTEVVADFFCVGAAIAFLVGDVLESPKWVQRAGLEWLYRLGREPGRLWKRYLFGNLQFSGMLIKDLTSRTFSRY
jgi:N-acetylglucosaminyldiphosphoundecaprenol N-acetyl-beta-D-mannosaminyltransferase